MSSPIEGILSDFSRFYILTILYEGPTHGYGILSRFRARLRKQISPSLVYPFLRRLEQKGIVTHTSSPVGEKDRKIFELTEEGRRLCKRLFRRFDNLISVAIEANLKVCAHCGCRLYESGHHEKIGGVEMTFCCVHCASSYKAEIDNSKIDDVGRA